MLKKIAIITLLVIVLVFVAGVAVYFGQQRQERAEKVRQVEEEVTTLPEPTPSETDTSDWKIYRNEEFGFEIKYPPELQGLERTYGNVHLAGINFRRSPEDLREPYYFSATREVEPLWTCCPSPPESGVIQTQVKLDVVTFTREEEIFTGREVGSRRRASIVYLGRYRHACYIFGYTHYLKEKEDPTELKNNIDRFEKIVSTFRILDSFKVGN